MNGTEDKTATAPHQRPRRGLSTLVAPFVIFAALATLFAFALRGADPTKLPSVLIGKPAPESPLPGVAELTRNGRTVPGLGTDAFKAGTPAVVNFWASWCGPCVQEHPLLMRLKQEVPAMRLIGINYKDEAGGARRFLGRYGNPFDAVGADQHGRVAIEWGVYGMPETFVVDKRGVIVFKHVGPLTEAAFASKLMPAIRSALGD